MPEENRNTQDNPGQGQEQAPEQGTKQAPGTAGGPQGGETPATWEKVLEGLPEEQRALYEQHTGSLRKALDSEREERKELASRLREATKGLEEGSKAREALEDLTSRLEAAEQRADFFGEASRPEIGCTNPELAFIVAKEKDLFDRRGNPRWEVLKEDFPQLFEKPAPPPSGAGAGTGQQPQGGFDMDRAIRRAAGRR